MAEVAVGGGGEAVVVGFRLSEELTVEFGLFRGHVLHVGRLVVAKAVVTRCLHQLSHQVLRSDERKSVDHLASEHRHCRRVWSIVGFSLRTLVYDCAAALDCKSTWMDGNKASSRGEAAATTCT